MLYSGILLSRKKDVIPPLVTTWMDPDSIVLSETGQRTRNQRFRSHVGYKTNEQTKETNSWLQKQNGGYQRGRGAGGHTHGDGRRQTSGVSTQRTTRVA